MLLGAHMAFAADSAAVAPAPAASKAAASAKGAAPHGKSVAKVKPTPAAKLVDINTASKEELKKLPGIDDAKAAKIIAGRPYGSKAQLVSHQAMDEQGYDSIRSLVIAKQPTKDVAKNEAAIAKKNLETQTPKK